MTLPSLVSFPPAHDNNPHPEFCFWAQCDLQVMANSTGVTEVEKTPTPEQNVNGQTDGAEGEEGAVNQPDSMSIEWYSDCRQLMMCRHLPGHH